MDFSAADLNSWLTARLIELIIGIIRSRQSDSRASSPIAVTLIDPS